MNSSSPNGSHGPCIVGALGCFGFAFWTLAPTRYGAIVPGLPLWMLFAMHVLVAIGLGTGARTTQSTAAWIGFAAFLGSTFLFALALAAGALLDMDRQPSPQMLGLAHRFLLFVQTVALLVWSVRSLWRGSPLLGPVLSLALLTELAIHFGLWFGLLGEHVPVDVVLLAPPIGWAALGLILLRLGRHGATAPRDYAGLPRDLPSALVTVWVIFLIVAYVVARKSLGRVLEGDEALVEPSVVTGGILIGLQCLLVAAVLWLVRVTGPGRAESPSPSDGSDN